MIRLSHSKLIILFIFICIFWACDSTKETDYTYLSGARIIDGNGGDPIENGIVVIEQDKVVGIYTSVDYKVPQNGNVIDVSGKTIIPGMINSHAHVGYRNQIDADHYSSEQIQNQLELYARFGITTVASLGSDRDEARAFQAKNDSTNAMGRARLYIAGNIITGDKIEDVKEKVDENARNGTDFIKIRVDNNRGRTQAMTQEIYKTVIDQSHSHGLMLMAHMYDLQIAKDLLVAGADFMAHSVRDQEVDEEFTSLLIEKDVCYCPTLTRDLSTYIYGDTAAFFSDPFFLKNANTSEVEELLDPQNQSRIKNSASYSANTVALQMALKNLKILSEAGVKIAMGTDSGMPNRFQGYFEHLEMELMAQAGMDPMKIIVSATKDAADCLKLKDVGTLEAGKLADFVVLDGNPLENITNAKRISSVWIGGKKINL